MCAFLRIRTLTGNPETMNVAFDRVMAGKATEFSRYLALRLVSIRLSRILGSHLSHTDATVSAARPHAPEISLEPNNLTDMSKIGHDIPKSSIPTVCRIG